MNIDDISIVVVAMNRNDRVGPCLTSWDDAKLGSEIILIDWGSAPAIEPMDHISTLRMHRYAAEHFILSRAYNTAIDMATNNYIIKIDIDYVLKDIGYSSVLKTCIEHIHNTQSCYYRASPEEDKHLSGLCVFKKEHFIQAGKYNEDMCNGWGGEDLDLYNRFKEKNIECKYLPDIDNKIYHIPHSSAASTRYCKIKHKGRSWKANMKVVDT
jgi:glycosyltransferase involved in cell wall biosynthesis